MIKSMIVKRVNFKRYVVLNFDELSGLRVVARCDSLSAAQSKLVETLYLNAERCERLPAKVWIEEGV